MAIWCLALILFCAAFSQQTVTVHVIPHATDIGISPTDAALILSITNIVAIVGSFMLGNANDKIGSRLSMVISIGILFIGSLLRMGSSALWTFYLFAVIFGLAWGGTGTLRSTMVANIIWSAFAWSN